jgi:hypothetical protein
LKAEITSIIVEMDGSLGVTSNVVLTSLTRFVVEGKDNRGPYAPAYVAPFLFKLDLIYGTYLIS